MTPNPPSAPVELTWANIREQDNVWLRKNGKTVPICLLDDHHLATIIKLLQRHHHQAINAIQDLNLAISNTAWMEVMETVYDMKNDGPAYPLYTALWSEWESRHSQNDYELGSYKYDPDYGRVRA